MKLQNIKRDNRVALLLVDAYKYILIIGRAFIAEKSKRYDRRERV